MPAPLVSWFHSEAARNDKANHEAPDKHGEPRLSIYVYLGC